MASVGVDSFGVDITEDGFDPNPEHRVPSSIIPEAAAAAAPPNAPEPLNGVRRNRSVSLYYCNITH